MMPLVRNRIVRSHENERHYVLWVCPNFRLVVYKLLCSRWNKWSERTVSSSSVALSSGTCFPFPRPWLGSMLSLIYPAFLSSSPHPHAFLLAKACCPLRHPSLSGTHSPLCSSPVCWSGTLTSPVTLFCRFWWWAWIWWGGVWGVFFCLLLHQ